MDADGWVEKEFTVQGELGLHARPAGRFASLAGRFESDVEVGRGEEWVNGTSVLSILSLAAARGTVLRIRARGQDADRALAALGELLQAQEPG